MEREREIIHIYIYIYIYIYILYTNNKEFSWHEGRDGGRAFLRLAAEGDLDAVRVIYTIY